MAKRAATPLRGLGFIDFGGIDFGGMFRSIDFGDVTKIGIDLATKYRQSQDAAKRSTLPTTNPAPIGTATLPRLTAPPAWWNEAAYLAENPDVAAWVKANPTVEGQPTSGWAHWQWWASAGDDRLVSRQRIRQAQAASPANQSNNSALLLAAGIGAALLLMR